MLRNRLYLGLIFGFNLLSAVGYGQARIVCDSAIDAKKNGHTDDEFRTARVYHSWAKGEGAVFDRSYVLKFSRAKCGKSGDPYQKPVVIFHGGGGSACAMRDQVEINTAAGVGGANSAPFVTSDCINNKKVLYVFPNGLKSSDAPSYEADGSLLFNPDYFLATNTASINSRQFNDGRDPNNTLKESQFISKIFQQLDGATINNTPVRLDGTIYTAGHSNGGAVQWKVMADEHRVAAAFLSAGLMPEPVANSTDFSPRAHIFMVHGKQEGMQLFEGTPGKQLGAYASLEKVAVDYGYREKDKQNGIYPNESPTLSDKYGNFMKDTFYGSYPPKKGKKLVLLTELGKSGTPNGPYMGPGHCWHGNTSVTSITIDGEKVTEECTAKFASTFWMLYSFTDADKWDSRK